MGTNSANAIILRTIKPLLDVFSALKRDLFALDPTRYMTGRPRKEKPPDPTLFLPNFSF